MRRPRCFGHHRVGAELEPGLLGRRFQTTVDQRPAVIEVVSVHTHHEVFERSLRRIEVMSAVHSPHLVPILDAGLDGDGLYVVTPAPSRLFDGIGADRAHVVRAVHAAGSGVAALHRSGIVHRDIQARHIGWYGGVVKLGGLGLVDYLGDGGTHGIGPIGGVLTMAPSIVRGSAATVGSDLYSLGATAHLMATGIAVHPVASESLAARVLRIAAEDPAIDPSLCPSLMSFVAAALAADGRSTDVSVEQLLTAHLQPPHKSGA